MSGHHPLLIGSTVVKFARLAAMAFVAAASAAGASPMTLDVDASDAPRGLVTSTMRIPVEPGPVALWYVEWTPGNHNPSGPIQNVVNMYVKDEQGRPIEWNRDPAQVRRILFDAPQGSTTVTVEFAYICNQPEVNSRSSDTYCYQHFGGLNWNTVLFYPEGADKDELMIRPSLRTPRGWRIATSLALEDDDDASAPAHRFKPVSLAELVDSPVIFGSTLRTYRLDVGDRAPHYVHAVAETDELTVLPPARKAKFERVVRQAEKALGPFPRSEFHFLLLIDDRLPGFGLEHGRSTYISMGSRELVDSETEAGGATTVVPHEYIHSWNGKLRAPRGLLARDYHTPGRTELMWVYEGMTSYYTQTLAVRSGLMSEEELKGRLASRIEQYQEQTGRRWRSVEDTGRALRFLRTPSKRWQDLRRRQDYYSEGALFWMEADAIIREGTGGERSLDDYCHAFYGVKAGDIGRLAEFSREDVVRALGEVYSGQDWNALIRERLETPLDDLRLALPERLGYRLDYTDEPTPLQMKREEASESLNLRTSLGFVVDGEGIITSLAPESPADRAKLAYGARIVAVGDHLFTIEAMRDAVRQSPVAGHVEMLVSFDASMVQRVDIAYDKGLRYPRLVRLEDRPDLLRAIAQPR